MSEDQSASLLGVESKVDKVGAVVTVLKRFVTDEKRFWAFFRTLSNAACKGLPFDCLDGQVVSSVELWSAVGEVRSLCDFPIQPEPMVEAGPTPFHQDIATIIAGSPADDPNEVDFNVVYARFPDKVYTLIKASSSKMLQSYLMGKGKSI